MNLWVLLIKTININKNLLQMCMGPKCPCIYPPIPHKTLKYISFRKRSPIFRNLNRNDVAKGNLSKIVKLEEEEENH